MRLVACFLFLCILGPAQCGNILVWFTEASHWINLKIVLDTLMDRGHNVTVLMPSASLFMDAKDSDRFTCQPFNVSVSEQDMHDHIENLMHFMMYEIDHLNLLQIHIKFYQVFSKDQDICLVYCDGVLKSPGLMEKLQHQRFDVMLADPIFSCSEIVAEVLNVPLVYTFRFSVFNTVERMCGQIPAPPSYVPGAVSKLTDKMSFTERIMNVLFYLSQDALARLLWRKFDNYYTEYLGSHWINLKIVLETLVDRGHNVTILVPDAVMVMNVKESDPFNRVDFNMSISSKEMFAFIEEILQLSMNEIEKLNQIQFIIKYSQLASKNLDIGLSYCDGILKSPGLLDKLQQGKFDVLLSDPIIPCSDILAEKLNVPLVFTYRFSIANIVERMCGQTPAPPSYVPGAVSKRTDKMSFTERIMSLLFYLLQDAFAKIMWKTYDNYYTEYLGRPSSYCEMMGKADIWLIRSYWDLEYPRPFLPNFKYVGGIHCTPAKPLPKDMEEFVESSGDDGIVVFSLGSVVENMTEERSNMAASALAQIPQKVLWRYTGEKPETLGANTRIYKWIPQNDLLGHRKTRAFITHGGTNGIYEAIFHGVPMVGIPLFLDQPDNMAHIKAKGAAVIMDFNRMKTEDLVDGLNAVINNPLYKKNAMRLSRIHHDRPMKPLDEAVFWIEFVMRNKGAKHLRVEAHNLTWYQYHCLDVFAFLFTIVTVVLYIFFKICKCLIIRYCFRSKHKSKRE
ncbi:UDP-glucuronosyltransferase 2C1-like isoform X2 [Paramisgurnus dabryanus]|uniref:UDP-glucuronosyltransferase 2C1-like isoform X2 n=1 Tax=Paramisgurnus dabryanus TaxID=90735 RepID=UPI0031F4509E